MKAIRVTEFGGPEVLRLAEVPTPSPAAGQVLEQGATQAFDHGAADYLDQIMRAASGRGVDVILEMLANRNLANDLKLLAPRGRVVVIGSRGRVEIDPRDTMGREADIRGMVLFNTPAEELAKIHAALYTGLENATLRPVVARKFPLADAAQAHLAILQPGAGGKIILDPSAA